MESAMLELERGFKNIAIAAIPYTLREWAVYWGWGGKARIQ